MNRVRLFEKSQFVSGELFHLLKKLSDNVLDTYYQDLFTDKFQELVFVKLKNKRKLRFNVTNMSNIQIVKTVIDKLIEVDNFTGEKNEQRQN
jgi:hypothetical protein